VVGATSNGYLALLPTATTSPGTQTLYVGAGDRRSNGATVALSSGRLALVWVGVSSSHADVKLEVTGYLR
jgi:hypothetical protein